MGSVYCVAWLVFVCVPGRFLGRCVLEDLMDSTDYDTGDNWNKSFRYELFQGCVDYF